MNRSTASNAISFGLFETLEYSIVIPKEWHLHTNNLNEQLFIGPNIGSIPIGFKVLNFNKSRNDLFDVMENAKKIQEKNPNYQLIREKTLRKGMQNAFLKLSTWFVEKKDMQVFVREYFFETEIKIFALSVTIPNCEIVKEIDQSSLKIFNSFRLK